MNRNLNLILVGTGLILLALAFSGGASVIAPQTATAAVWVFEKDQGEPPPGIMAVLDRLNRERGIKATKFEVNTVDGDGETPDQYKVPHAAAEEVGLPAFVVLAGDEVLNAVLDPNPQEAWEAVP